MIEFYAFRHEECGIGGPYRNLVQSDAGDEVSLNATDAQVAAEDGLVMGENVALER